MTAIASNFQEFLHPSICQLAVQPSAHLDTLQAKGLKAVHVGAQPQNAVPPSSTPQQLSIQVNLCNGRNIRLSVSPGISVRELKVKIAGVSGMPAESQILYFKTRTLEDGTDLRSYQLKGTMGLQMVHKVMGG